jgi:hypothetical protein
MTGLYWRDERAYSFVCANYPLEDRLQARLLIERMLEEGRLSSQYRRPDGSTIAIKREEWVRRAQPPGFETDGVGELDWSGYQAEVEREEAQTTSGHIGYGYFEVEASTLRQLCAAGGMGDLAQTERGRPPRAIVSRLLVLAGKWLTEEGLPAAGDGKQAALERFLRDEAGDQLTSESRIREIAKEAIGIIGAHLKAGK